jgi:hypothetical protein
MIIGGAGPMGPRSSPGRSRWSVAPESSIADDMLQLVAPESSIADDAADMLQLEKEGVAVRL